MKLFKRFHELRLLKDQFLNSEFKDLSQTNIFTNLLDDKWINKLAFRVDLLGKLNHFTLQLEYNDMDLGKMARTKHKFLADISEMRTH